MTEVMELLLKAEMPDLPSKEIKIKRLSDICGGPVVFSLKALTFSQVAELKEAHNGDNLNLHIILAGVVSPDLKAKELLAKYNAVTPLEMLKKMLLPGELEDISREVEKLSGYRSSTLEEIKKK